MALRGMPVARSSLAMSNSTSAVLVVEGLRIETDGGVEIVGDMSFEVFPGEVLALVGESGCGKTSTALALLGHARPGTRISAGTVRLMRQDILQQNKRTRRRSRGAQISYVPQDPAASLNPRQRIGAQIAEVLTVHGMSSADAKSLVSHLARSVGLQDNDAFLCRYPFELSGGQQQRVVIAMALACRPLVVVLDEPTTGLDVTTQARILNLLRELGRSSGAAFIYVTHDLAVVDNIASRVLVMYAGRIVEAGPRTDVLHQAAHPYTALLVASVPRLADRHRLSGIAGAAPAPVSRPPGCFFAPRCPLVSDRCRVEFPPVTMIAQGHSVRCWHARDRVALVSTASVGDFQPDFTSMPVLAVYQLVAAYGRGAFRLPVVRGVTFELNAGECLAVVGESGSGKSTIGRCIVGLHPPETGSVTLRGVPLAPLAQQRRHGERQAIQLIFQNPDRSLNPNETIGAAIQRPLRLFGLSEHKTERAQVAQLLERVRLPTSMLDRYPRELSGGEKQRVAIARALAAKPSLLLCDEITSSLDVSTQAAIVALLEELKTEGLALLFITHNLALVHSIADRILVLEAGEIRELGSAAEVISHPAHRYTRELVAAAPELGRSG
jgi:peptide/nickel transport system ATP-binding protein